MPTPDQPANSFLQLLRNRFFLVYALILSLVDFAFPVTFTFDSGHYFSYMKVLDGDLPWSAWDPFRGFVLPFFLKLDTILLGRSTAALLIPMVLAHLFLFAGLTWLVLQAVQPASRTAQNLLITFAFLFIGMDALIIGWYHVILTEFMASALAMLACLMAFGMVRRVQSGGKMLPFFLGFSILAVITWHLKQPHLGVGIYPLLLASFVLVLKNWKGRFIVKVAAGNLLVLVSLLASIAGWKAILPPYEGAPLEYDRFSDWWLPPLQRDLELWRHSPKSFLRNYTDNYLTLANMYYWQAEEFFDHGKFVIDRNFSLTRARENQSMAYRIYEKGEFNQATIPPRYQDKVAPYAARYNPPDWLNTVLKGITLKSNFLFSSLYLCLPLAFVVLLWRVMVKKPLKNWLVITFLLCGSALLNALLHSLFNLPADRYLFWGYPLLLCACLIGIVLLGKAGWNVIHRVKEKDHAA